MYIHTQSNYVKKYSCRLSEEARINSTETHIYTYILEILNFCYCLCVNIYNINIRVLGLRTAVGFL